MNCTEARELFDLHLDRALEPAVCTRLEDHLRDCPSCRAAYQAFDAESQLLKQALQADLSTTAAISRIEARVRQRTRPSASAIADLEEWIAPVLGIVIGLFVLLAGRFDGAAVRASICLSLNPRGGLTVALPSILVAALGILAVITIQSLIFRTSEQD